MGRCQHGQGVCTVRVVWPRRRLSSAHRAHAVPASTRLSRKKNIDAGPDQDEELLCRIVVRDRGTGLGKQVLPYLQPGEHGLGDIVQLDIAGSQLVQIEE